MNYWSRNSTKSFLWLNKISKCLTRKANAALTNPSTAFIATCIVTYISFVTCIIFSSSVALAQDERPPVIQGENSGNLGDLVESRIRKPMEFDEQKVRGAGIEKIEGKFIDIYTDNRGQKEIQELTEVFDQAISFWCSYFKVDESKVNGWKLSCFIMVDQDRFTQSGVYPDDLPPFPAGYQRGHEMWLYVQRGDYYTRHLFLHEGTHAFMSHFLEGVGPPWFAEGMAELLSVHRWDGTQLEMNYRHNRREDVPYWGRVKIVRDDLKNEKSLLPTEIMSAKINDFQNVRWYAWAWALCRFFDSHPEYQAQFRKLKSEVKDHTVDFSLKFWNQLEGEHESLTHDWNLFLQEMDYGVNLEAILLSDIDKNEDGTMELSVSRGWQDTGIEVTAGQKLSIMGDGRFILKRDPLPWWSEAEGVTIEYFNSRPLGRLLAAIPDEDAVKSGRFTPIDIGRNGVIPVSDNGRLFLKINDSPAQYYDNEGSIKIQVEFD